MVALRGPGVRHSDGYIELRDRAKDIVISSGENISTIEIEHAIEAHPAVLELQTHIARFKPPGNIEFVDHLPRTSTSKLQKFELREKDWAGHTSRIQG